MTTIKVCDAIMGSGKSEGCITMMNEHPERTYLYITPYLPETDRILASCPDLHFIKPSDEIPAFHYSKTEHCAHLLSQGFNVASTHQLFKLYTDDMLNSIRNNHYTLIIDEAVDVFADAEVAPADVRLLADGGYIVPDGDTYSIVRDDYEGGKLRDIFTMLRHNQLVECHHKGKVSYYYWQMPKEILAAFDEIYVLTYMFDCQDFCYYMQINDIPYRYIGVDKDESGTYRLVDGAGYVPEYVTSLKDKIHIDKTGGINQVGNDRTALSINWLSKHRDKREIVKANLYNYFVNHCRGIDESRRLWGSYKDMKTKLKGKGYSKRFLQFSQKSSNAYRDKDHLAYCSNVFMNPDKRNWLTAKGAQVKEDEWAVSIMVQWIWRSAIRDGEEIWIYIPSKRMRTLLENWIDEVSSTGLEGGDDVATVSPYPNPAEDAGEKNIA